MMMMSPIGEQGEEFLVLLSKWLRLRSLIVKGELRLRTIVFGVEMNVRGECCLLFGPSIHRANS